jgi:hypothetical protein
MTLAQIREKARRYARVTVTDKADTDVNELIHDAQIEMARDVYGLKKTTRLSLAEAFTIETNFYINVTIVGGTNALAATDVQVSASALSRATGAAVATALQALLRTAVGGGANLTVAWTDYYFTLDAIDSTSITISAISDDVNYVDASELIFGVTGTQTGTSFTGEFPQDCTWETAVPSDYLKPIRLTWDGYLLEEKPHGFTIRPEMYGNYPRWYSVWDDYIRLIPSPNVIKEFVMEYKSLPTRTEMATDGVEASMPDRFVYGLVYLVASELLMMGHEDESLKFLAKYRKVRNEMRIYESSQNPKLTPPNDREPPFANYTITTTAAD